jgi:hypothetical protein
LRKPEVTEKYHIICLITLHVIKKMRSSGGIKTAGNRREIIFDVAIDLEQLVG